MTSNDLISRQIVINAVENTNIQITESEWEELMSAISSIPCKIVYCKDCAMWERDHISCEGFARCCTGEGGYVLRKSYDFCSKGIWREIDE